jgi:hypothetical protein
MPARDQERVTFFYFFSQQSRKPVQSFHLPAKNIEGRVFFDARPGAFRSEAHVKSSPANWQIAGISTWIAW